MVHGPAAAGSSMEDGDSGGSDSSSFVLRLMSKFLYIAMRPHGWVFHWLELYNDSTVVLHEGDFHSSTSGHHGLWIWDSINEVMEVRMHHRGAVVPWHRLHVLQFARCPYCPIVWEAREAGAPAAVAVQVVEAVLP